MDYYVHQVKELIDYLQTIHGPATEAEIDHALSLWPSEQ